MISDSMPHSVESRMPLGNLGLKGNRTMKAFSLMGACALLSLTMVTDARAVFVTETATVQAKDTDDGPPLVNIRRIDGTIGHVYTNQYTNTTPFAVGSEIRTVTANLVNAAINGEAYQPLQTAAGNDIVALASVRGSIVASGGGSATANFTSGRLYLLSVAPGTFDPRNPDTFAFSPANMIAEYALLPPDTVVQGSGQALFFAASQINQSSVNTTTPQQADGRFLFAEDPASDFITIENNTLGIPVAAEGILAQVFQTVEFADLEELTGPALTASDLAVLNAIANDAIGVDFATGFGDGPPSNWNPDFIGAGNNISTTGDFRGELQARNSPGITAIPEPSSMALMAMALGIGGIYRVRRRSK